MSAAPSGDLFGEAPDPPAPKRKLDLRTEYLRETNGLPEGWVWHSFRAIGDGYAYALYEGGVYPWAITKGKRKGQTNYSRPAPGTERSLVISDREFEAWLPTWEARTGKCHLCKGTGQEWIGWNHDTGDKLRDCPRCGATGNAPCDRDRRGEAIETACGLDRRQEPGPSGIAQNTGVS